MSNLQHAKHELFHICGIAVGVLFHSPKANDSDKYYSNATIHLEIGEDQAEVGFTCPKMKKYTVNQILAAAAYAPIVEHSRFKELNGYYLNHDYIAKLGNLSDQDLSAMRKWNGTVDDLDFMLCSVYRLRERIMFDKVAQVLASDLVNKVDNQIPLGSIIPIGRARNAMKQTRGFYNSRVTYRSNERPSYV